MGAGWTTMIDGIALAPGPISIDGSPADPTLAPPRLGEHTEVILRELSRTQPGR
jgi:hypothetical protein